MAIITLPTHYYRQFDADYSLDVPGEGYGGWDKADLPLNLDHTALVVMHALDCGTNEQVPGHFRAVEYIPRSYDISRTVFPGLLGAVRASGMKVAHVGMGESYCKPYPGYRRIVELSGPGPALSERADEDPVSQQLIRFRADHVFPGANNHADITKGYPLRKFPREAEPVGDEAVALTSHQLNAWCKREKINHLIYIGFAINWCLLMSPGGMLDMSRNGIICSAIRQAVTAVENKETARLELNKELALWRVALAFGFVYDADDVIEALRSEQG
ncbi:hypothetical protein [Paenibacillus contaminans]|uniref:Isochorismatase-like domain-containing protein n=1 Tax=Paenibacillus contaminans TaxID=450362 RepID=A0A329LM98_9BACL|nr:hypothetical protein [Paenibacillus contaminans]RAV08172.1 hypothetical protein DQG23_41445 [Paenibacillus contaminans]